MPLISVPQPVTTELYLCKNVIVDPSYNHVYDFSTPAQQERYFTEPWSGNPNTSGKAFYIFNNSTAYGNLTFQRIGQGFRVPINREVLEENGINYLCFRNTRVVAEQQETKTFTKMYYCFITSMHYVNENVTEIYYDVDIFQTYMFDFEIRPCFIEREMINVEDDLPGNNIVTESIGYGDYIQYYLDVNDGIDVTFPNDEWNVVLATTFNRDFSPINDQNESKGVYNYFGIASGLAYLVFDSADMASLARWLISCQAQNNTTGIQAAYVVPKAICNGPTGRDYDDDIEPTGGRTQTLAGYANYLVPTSLGSYTNVRNKKLLTYPYNMLFLTNNNSESRIYRWEYFEKTVNDEVTFLLAGCPIMPVEAAMIPLRYNGSGPDTMNMWERLVMTDFPICSFDTDVFRAYMAANKFKVGANFISGMFETVSSFGSLLNFGRKKLLGGTTIKTTDNTVRNRVLKDGTEKVLGTKNRTIESTKENYQNLNPIDMGTDTFNSLLNVTGSLADIASKPPQAYGQTTNILNMATSMAGFNAYQTCIRPEYAKIIDDYFDKFGYACHEIKSPNLNNRLHWNYVKTLDVLIVPKPKQNNDSAALNTREIMNLQAIFDNGVTIWHCMKNSNGAMTGEANFGNYSNNNHVAGGN